jgi:hypothetical protein
MPLFAGCHVIAIEALMPNAARALQTFAAAPPSEKFGSWLQRLHVFNNAVGNTRGNVTIKLFTPNPGASFIGAFDPLEPGVTTVSSVVMEDLLYDTPPAQRPQITLGDGSVVPLQPRHVYMVKVDVEGFDVAALHGLRRLLMEDERPVAVTIEFLPRAVPWTLSPCDAVEFTRFMYGQGYVYEGVVDVEDMVAAVSASFTDGSYAFEGWWRQRSLKARLDVQPPPPSHAQLDDTAAALAALPASPHPDFCYSGEVLQGAVGTSRFHDLVGDDVRRSARLVAARGAGTAATAGSIDADGVLAAFVNQLAALAPCHWARYTALLQPLPKMCTHDPQEDTVVAARIHKTGRWFTPHVPRHFAAMLVNGSCPPDRPVVLDLGLFIGCVQHIPGVAPWHCDLTRFSACSQNVVCDAAVRRLPRHRRRRADAQRGASAADVRGCTAVGEVRVVAAASARVPQRRRQHAQERFAVLHPQQPRRVAHRGL